MIIRIVFEVFPMIASLRSPGYCVWMHDPLDRIALPHLPLKACGVVGDDEITMTVVYDDSALQRGGPLPLLLSKCQELNTQCAIVMRSHPVFFSSVFSRYPVGYSTP